MKTENGLTTITRVKKFGKLNIVTDQSLAMITGPRERERESIIRHTHVCACVCIILH